MMKYYSAWKRRGISTQATAWMDLDDIAEQILCFHLREYVERPCLETGSRRAVARGWDWGWGVTN